MKRIGLISIIVIVAVWLLVFTFSTKITAEIPSASGWVPAFKDFTVQFSEPMNPDSFTMETVTVKNKNGGHVSAEMDWNDSHTILTLRAPEEGYTIDEKYELTISNDVTTEFGNNLSKSLQHSFTAVADLPKIKNKKQLISLLKERMEEKKEIYTMEMAEAESSDMKTAASDDSVADGSGTSSTNVQVDGIDEADIIKTDGQSIFFVRDHDIVITSAEKANSKVLSQIAVDNFFPREIYLHNNLLITIGEKSMPLRKPHQENRETTSDKKIGIPEQLYYSQTAVYFYDITNPSAPRQIREVSHEGYYKSSRILDGYLYLIANERPPYHILRQNDDIEIRPFIQDSVTGEESKPVDFDHMYFFPESKDEQFLILTSIDLQNMEKQANIETYLGASDQIYMSHNNLYIAVNKYTEPEPQDNKDVEILIWRPHDVDTEINQFHIEDGSLKYNASTVVNGTLINQFAMDERNNIFRVATTKGNVWNEEKESTNNLYTFDNNLQPLGSVEGLAKGERIYSVRFMENVAYMVTFKQTDPLFVIDLKDPRNPTVLGKLKIPGFSNYLHPLDDNHVIGFGQDTKLIKETGMREPIVRTNGIKISVFDVSDPANPKEKYTEVIGQTGSHSELFYNHKALFKHPTKNLFGFPAILTETKIVNKGDIRYEEYNHIFEGALLYKITAMDGIQLVDTITHQAEVKDYPEWTSEIKRMVSVDDTLYTFSWDKMKAYDIDEKQEIKTVSLPELSFEY